MTANEIDLRDTRPSLSADAVNCASCRKTIQLFEVFDGWELGRSRDECPQCGGVLLAPLVTA